MRGWHNESYRHYLAAKKITTSKKVKRPRELIVGGLADGRRCSEFDKKQMEMGQKVEMEHTNNPFVAREIAKDHLAEDPEYYTHLAEMENKYMAKKHKFTVGIPMKDYEWGEWEVPVYKDGKKDEGRSYYTGDKEDAFETYKELKKNEDAAVESRRDELRAFLDSKYVDATPSGDERSLIAEKQADAVERAKLAGNKQTIHGVKRKHATKKQLKENAYDPDDEYDRAMEDGG